MPEISPLVLIATAALVGVVAIGLLARPLIRALLGGETFVEIEGKVQPKAEPKAETQAKAKARPQTRAQAQPKAKAKSKAQDQPGTAAKPGIRLVAPKPEAEAQPEAQPAAAPTPIAAVATPEAPATAAQPPATTAPPPLSTATFAPEQLNPAAALVRKKRRPGASLTPFRTMAGALVKKK